MAQMIHRRDFNRTLEHLYDRSPGTVDMAALRNTMEAMAKAGERLRTRWENECSYEWANTPAYMAATERLAERIHKMAEKMGLQLYLQTDPRGASVYVSWEPIADNNYNRSGSYCLFFKGRDW